MSLLKCLECHFHSSIEMNENVGNFREKTAKLHTLTELWNRFVVQCIMQNQCKNDVSILFRRTWMCMENELIIKIYNNYRHIKQAATRRQPAIQPTYPPIKWKDKHARNFEPIAIDNECKLAISQINSHIRVACEKKNRKQ